MNTTIFKNAKCIISTCSKGIIKIIPFFIMSVLSMPVQAGILLDTVNTVSDKVTTVQTTVNKIPATVTNRIQTRLEDLPQTVQNKLEMNLDPALVEKIKEAIDEVRVVVEDQTKAIADFDATQCATFKDDLVSMFGNLGELANSVSSLGLPNPPQFTLPDSTPLDDIPCKLLVGPALVLGDKLEVIGEKLTEMNAKIQVLLPLFIAEIEVPSTPELGTKIINTTFCENIVLPKRNEIDNAVKVIHAASIFLQVIASKIDTKTVTGVIDIGKLKPEAKEVDAGIWGWAHITVQKQSARHKFANGINSVVKLMDKIQSKASDINSGCIDTYNQKILAEQQDKILKKQNSMLERQSKILKRQTRILAELNK